MVDDESFDSSVDQDQYLDRLKDQAENQTRA